MHKAQRPRFLFSLIKLCINVTKIRAPEQPNGCPSAIDPPFIFTFKI